jgi:hypothetical protein
MKKIVFLMLVVAFASCKNKTAETQNQAAATATKESVSPPSVSNPKCAITGELKEKFEQNGAKFERFVKKVDPKSESEEQADEWLRITKPDGTCAIVDSIGNGNHYGCAFEDWDGDGFKDRVEYFKWNAAVHLFSKETNTFQKIDGSFNGDQWDFDKAKGLKWQYLEDKTGGMFQLYKLEGLVLKPISEVNFQETEEEGYAISVRNDFVLEGLGYKNDSKKMNADKFLLPLKERGEEQYTAMMERWKASVKRYWTKNLGQILK